MKKENLRKILLAVFLILVVPAAIIAASPWIRTRLGLKEANESPDARRVAGLLAAAREAAGKGDWAAAKQAAQAVLGLDPRNGEALAILRKASEVMGSGSAPTAEEREILAKLREAEKEKNWAEVLRLARKGLASGKNAPEFAEFLKKARGRLALEKAREALQDGRIGEAEAAVKEARADGVRDEALEKELEQYSLYLKGRVLVDKGNLAEAEAFLNAYRMAGGRLGRLANFVSAIANVRRQIRKGNYPSALVYFDDARRRMPEHFLIRETRQLLRRTHPWLLPQLVFDSSTVGAIRRPLAAAVLPKGRAVACLQPGADGVELLLVRLSDGRVLWRKGVRHPVLKTSAQLVCSPSGKVLALASSEGSISFHSTEDGRRLSVARLEGIRGSIVFGGPGSALFAVDRSSTVRTIRVDTGGSAEALSGRYVDLAGTSAGTHLVAVEASGRITVWRTSRLREPVLRHDPGGPAVAARFMDDGRTLIYIQAGSFLIRRGVRDVQPKRIAQGDFSAAGLVTSGNVVAVWHHHNDHVDVYEPRQGKHLSFFKTGFTRTRLLRTTPDGRFLFGLGVVGSRPRSGVRVWKLGE